MNLSITPQAQVQGKAQVSETGLYGVHDLMTKGFTSVRSQMCTGHPLQQSERNFKANSDKMRMHFLRTTQGLHAPLKLIHEKNSVNKEEELSNISRQSDFNTTDSVKRLPFLPSSNLALETLEGRDEFIDWDDYIFNDPYEGVESIATPQMVMENALFSKKSP